MNILQSTEERKINREQVENKSTEESAETTEPKMSLQQPTWHVVVLTALTFTSYIPYWLYKTCRDLRSYARARASEGAQQLPELTKYESIPAFLWGLSVVVPFLNLVALTIVFRDIAIITANDSGSGNEQNPVFSALVLTLSAMAIWVLGRVDNPLFLLFTLTGIPVAFAQNWLNQLWKSVEASDGEERLVRHAFSPFEIISIIIGAMALAMVVVGFSVVPAK